jgi:phosphoribosyl 1,2-cyclic phosphate phosphodiesterase
MVFLGTGTSVGVPVVGCGCPTCTSSNPRNQRLRCALVVGLPEGMLLVDTPPDLRTQLLREKIGVVHSVLFTHDHADHVFGLDDLRLFPYYLGRPLPVYCEEQVEARIRKSFDYAFAEAPYAGGAVPQIEFRRITTEPFAVLGARVIPMRLAHGRFEVLGFRFGNVAYCTDTNEIPPESRDLLRGLDVLVLDALRHKPHPTHYSLEEAVATARSLGARRTYFTHMSHELEHEATNAVLPAGMELAYDGLRVPLT